MAGLDIRKVDVEDFLAALQVENVQAGGPGEVLFSCPFPGHSHGDEKPSAYMNTGSVDESRNTLWFCHGCKRKGNAISFLADYEQISFFTAERYLREEYDSNFREPIGGSFAAEWDAHFDEIHSVKPDETPVYLEEEVMDDFLVDWHLVKEAGEDAPESLMYMLDRGFSPYTLNDWEFGYDEQSDRITIPVRDSNGRLVGFKARACDPDNEPRYLNLGQRENSRKSYPFKPYKVAQYVFGLDRVAGSDLIVVEGELNVVAMHQFGYTNTVGLGGSNLSARQVEILKWHADSLLLFFDEDKAGEQATANAIQHFIPFMKVTVAGAHDKDAADMNIDELHETLGSSYSALNAIIDL